MGIQSIASSALSHGYPTSTDSMTYFYATHVRNIQDTYDSEELPFAEDETEDDSPQGYYFAYVNRQGWALPTQRFWELWNSPFKVDLQRVGYRPKPQGDRVGAPEKWIVWLPGSPC